MHRFRKRELDMQKPDLDYNLRFKAICRTVVLRIINMYCADAALMPAPVICAVRNASKLYRGSNYSVPATNL